MTVATDRPPALALSWRDRTIRVESRESAALHWLAEFLGPAFAPTHGAAPAHGAGSPSGASIHLAVDPALHEEIAARAPAEPIGEIDLFTRDGEFHRSPCWIDAMHGRVIRDRRAPVLLLPSGDAPAGHRIVASRMDRWVRLFLMRVPRELATVACLRAGDLPLHASSIAVGGVTLAFAGPRRSGKTSLLLHLLGATGVQFVSNDRLMVEPRAGAAPMARGMPTIVTLREGTLDHAPAIRDRLRGRNYHSLRSLEECAGPAPSDAPVDAPADRPTRLSAAQLCAGAEVRACAGGPLGAIVFPRVDPEADGVELRRLPLAESAARLRASLLLASLPERTAAAFDDGAPPHRRDSAALDALAADIAARTPCHEARLGRGAYQESPQRLIDALIG